MTPVKNLPAWMRKKTAVAPWVKRLNIILRASYTDLRQLENGAWQRLLDDLHFAILSEQRNREDSNNRFNRAVKERPPVWDALTTLKKELDADNVTESGEPLMQFQIEAHSLQIRYSVDSLGGFFDPKFETEHFPSMLYLALAHILNASMLTKEDFRECSNATCKMPFVPLRKPRPGNAVYCSNRCARIVAARNYRKNKAAKRKAKKKKNPK
jgi:hypothetical protein